MHDHRLIQLLQSIQHPHHLFNIMPVYRTDILDSEILEKAAFYKQLSDGILGFLDTSGHRISHMRNLLKLLLNIYFEIHIGLSCTKCRQMP